MDLATALELIAAARGMIDTIIINTNAQRGLTDDEKRQILDAAGRSDAAFDDAVDAARARLGGQ